MTFRIADWRQPGRIAVRDPRALVEAAPSALSEWRKLGFRAQPILSGLFAEFEEFADHLRSANIQLVTLRESRDLSLDCLYVRDALALSPIGLIKCRMAKAARIAEPNAVSTELGTLGYAISGSIDEPGTLEGGDVVWLSDQLCAIGLSYRTTLEGATQFKRLCPPSVEFIFVELPYYRGPDFILHLSSLCSVIAEQCILADMRYLPVRFVEFLQSRGFRILPVPDDDRSTLGANVLSVGNDKLISISGNACTQAMLASEGFQVISMRGDNIGILGDGGPTCLTRPLKFI